MIVITVVIYRNVNELRLNCCKNTCLCWRILRTSVSGLSSEVWKSHKWLTSKRLFARSSTIFEEKCCWGNFLFAKMCSTTKFDLINHNREISTWKVIKQSISNSARFSDACPKMYQHIHEIFMRRCRDKSRAPDERTLMGLASCLVFFSLFSRSWKTKLLKIRYVNVGASLKWWWFFSWNNWKKKKQKKQD